MTSLHDVLEKKLQDQNATPMFLPLEFLKTITCDFSTESELGRGGYGVVYKGVLRSGKIIAVKKLLETLIKHEAFQNEISFLMGIKHQNVVQFVGYCAESRWEAIEQPSGSGKHILAEIQKRLLCFEYVSNKSLDIHIADRSLDLEWNIRYKIIIGICNGLHFLHEECRIIHLDLKPENILMDSNMQPKIADFGLSRLFGEQQSKVFTDNRAGTRGYMAPEYINKGLITKKADIFSLGVIIIEIVTGRRDYPNFQLDSPENTATSCQHFTEEVLGSWRSKFESAVKYISIEKYNHQVKECITIALKCVDPGMEKRPTVKDVIQVLNDKMETSKELPSEMQCMDKSQVLDTNASNKLILHSTTEDISNINTGDTVGKVKKSQECLLPTPVWTSITSSQNHQDAAKESSEPQQSSDKTSELIPESSMILDIHPLELCFFYEPDKLITCSLDITNNTDEKMAFALEKKSIEEMCILSSWPRFGVMDPRTTYTLVLIMEKHQDLRRQTNVDLILHTSTYCNSSSDEKTCARHFQNAELLGITVHQVTLKYVCAPRGVTIFEPIPSSIKIISMIDYPHIDGFMMRSIDANQTGLLIATSSYSDWYISIWDCDAQEYVDYIKINELHATVRSAKFIARKGWLVVGTDGGHIRVYNYKKKMQETTSFKVGGTVKALAIHPTESFMLSACGRGTIKLWDWDQGRFGWKCMQTFQEHSDYVRAVAFNPQDHNSFASASDDCTIKVWSRDSPKSKYTLYGHSSYVVSLDFFTRDGQQYLITGSRDKTAKVWDMHKKECAGTLPHNSAVVHVLSHPTLLVLVTGTEHGHVHLWSSINFGLKRVVAIGGGSWIKGLACFNHSGRVVVAHESTISVIEILDEEEQGGSSSNSISALH